MLDIYPSLGYTTAKNFKGIFCPVEMDLERWSHLPQSLRTRVSIIKIDLLPQVNFFSLLPLPPPTNCWDKIHSLFSKFIWGGSQLKMSTLQRHKSEGGLSVPNFKHYFWSFVLHLYFIIWPWRRGSPFPSDCKIWFTLLYHLNALSYAWDLLFLSFSLCDVQQRKHPKQSKVAFG